MNFTFTLESESKIQDKQKFTKIFSWKKLIPSGATRPLPNCPSPPLSSSWPLHAEIFLPLCRLFTPSDSLGRASSTHVGAPGSTPGVEDGDGWQRNKDPPRCRCSLVTKTVMMAPLPPQAGWVEGVGQSASYLHLTLHTLTLRCL